MTRLLPFLAIMARYRPSCPWPRHKSMPRPNVSEPDRRDLPAGTANGPAKGGQRRSPGGLRAGILMLAALAALLVGVPGTVMSQTSTDATLNALTVSPKNILGFNSDRTSYEVGVAATVAQATVTATANNSGAEVTYLPDDADSTAAGHQVALSPGRNEVTVTVTAQDGTTTKQYTVSINQGVTDGFGWNAGADLDGLVPLGDDHVHGIWSDGNIVWVTDRQVDRIYAYLLADGTRHMGRDIDLGGDNNQPRGLWSDGETMWVADSSDDKVYAYRLSDGDRQSGKEFDFHSSTGLAAGIWSNGETMWVSDWSNNKVFAYRLSDGDRQSGKEFDFNLGPIGARGLWSDGETLWVSDNQAGKLFAFALDGGARQSGRDFNTLGDAGNSGTGGIWSDGATMWVVDGSDAKVYAYNLPPSDNAAVISLTVSPRDIIGFDADRTSYEVGVDSEVTFATVAATTLNRFAEVTYLPDDADSTAAGHQVALSPGRNEVTVTATAQDGTTTSEYTISINRGVTDDFGWKAGADLDGLITAVNLSPQGIWSNATTVWVADTGDDKLYAYLRSDGTRQADKDISLHSENENPRGIWSDGKTVWVADFADNKVYAYRLSDGGRQDGTGEQQNKEFDFNSENADPQGIWSDGATMWVADFEDDKLYAYRLSDGGRLPPKGFSLDPDNSSARGIWSDGTIVWVADLDDKLYAYVLDGGARYGDRDFDTLSDAGNEGPTGIWSDGAAMWVADKDDDKVYAYNMPPPLTHVTVSFGSSSYDVFEGNSVRVTVTLNIAPERTVTIPITVSNEGGASAADYSGVPADLTFNAGQTSRSFNVAATADDLDDGGESVRLGFGTLPAAVAPGPRAGTMVRIVSVEKLGGNESINLTLDYGIGFFAEERIDSTVHAAFYAGLATSFTPGGDGWHALSAIGFEVIRPSTTRGHSSGLVRVAIHGDNSGSPAAGALYVAYAEVPAGTSDLRLTATFPDNAALEAGDTYWAVFDELTGVGQYHLEMAAGSSPNKANEDPGFESWEIGDTGYEINYLTATGFTWTATTHGPLLMTFYGYAEPERVLVGAHELRDTADDGPFLRFGDERVTKAWLNLPKDRTFDFCEPAFVAGSDTETSWRLCDLHPDSHYDHDWAGGRGFTTGPHPTGYTITGLGVDIDLESETANPFATIHTVETFHTRRGARDPHSYLAFYRAQTDISRSPDRFAPTSTVSEELQVDPERTYVAYFDNANPGYFQTPNAAAGQDPGAEAGWTLGRAYGSRFVRPVGFGGDDWNFGEGDRKRIPLNIHGWPNPLPAAPNPDPPAPAPALVGNLGKAANATGLTIHRRSPIDYASALSFSTGTHKAGYALRGVQIEVKDAAVSVGVLRAAIHADEGGNPGASLHEMALRVNPRPGIVTFHAADDITLSPRTTYWLVVDAADTAAARNIISAAVTKVGGQDDCAARDWTLGSAGRARLLGGNTWPRGSSRLKMAILGERASGASAEFGEPACGDLPDNATTTGRLIVDGNGVRGEHHTQDEADWYAVDLEADTDYLFVAASPSGSRTYALKIYDESGMELHNGYAPKKHKGGFVFNEFVNHTPYRPESADTYYVSIAHPTSPDPDNLYHLSVRTDDHPQDTTTEAVAEVEEPTRVYLMRKAKDAGDDEVVDIDWVRVSLLANVRYLISLDVGGCTQTAVIEGIHDSDGTEIPMTSSSGACDAGMYFTPTTKGDYYIAVSGKGSKFPGVERYPFIGANAILEVSLVPNYCAGESFDTLQDTLTPSSEPSDEDLTADTSTYGRAPIGSSVTGNIASGTDRDWFRVRFNGRQGERTYWLELNGADTGDGTLPDPRIIGIYDRRGTHIPYSHIGGQWKTYDNDSGYGRNAITDFTEPCAGDYYVEVAGYEGSTGTYTLSVRDITDTSTSIPADDVDGRRFALVSDFDGSLDETFLGDELVGNLVPGSPATIPAYAPTVRSPEEVHEGAEDYVIPETNQGGVVGDSDLFRLRVVPNRNYRLELSFPGTTDGRPANVGIQLFSVYQDLFDLGLGDAEDTTFRIGQRSSPLDGEVSLEFRARQFIEVEGRLIPDRVHGAFYLGEYHFEPGDLYTMVLTDITHSGDDYLGAYETTGAVAVGGSVTGNLEVDNDVDWFRVPLETGKTYQIRMRGTESGGGTLADPYVSVRADQSLLFPFGFEIGAPENDDKSETEKDSELVVTVFATGDFYVGAETPGTGTGTYTIGVEEVTPQNQRANTPATGWPGIIGTVQTGETLTATTDGIADEDGLSGAVFAYRWVRQDMATFDDTDIEEATGSTYTVTDADEGKAIKVRVTFTDDAGNEESLTSNAHLSVPPLVIPDEEETPLTATIHDAPESHDGQEDFTFELRFSEEPEEDFSFTTLKDHAFTVTRGTVEGRKVDGARRLVSSSNIRWEITVSPDSNADVTVKLPATEDCEADGAVCTDDGRMLSGELELTVSGPDSQQAANTPATGDPSINGTAQVGETLTADTSSIADEDGLDNVSFSYQWQADGADISGATGSAYTLADADEGRAISVKVSFTDDAGNEELLTSAATGAVEAKPNAPATGAPSIDGTAQVGETLTADPSGIADEDGLDNVSFSYQWVADDTDIDGATDSSYTLSEDDVGKSIQVQVSFEDDADNEESLTSAATATVAARPSLTASVLNAPQNHNGGDKFTFELRFSEEIEEDFSYETLKDHAFTVTGGTVAGARRLVSGSNIRWEITVSPDSNADVTVKLPATEDCGADSAVCTEDGRMLSEGLEFTVSRPGS